MMTKKGEIRLSPNYSILGDTSFRETTPSPETTITHVSATNQANGTIVTDVTYLGTPEGFTIFQKYEGAK